MRGLCRGGVWGAGVGSRVRVYAKRDSLLLLLFSGRASTMCKLQREMFPSLRQLEGWDIPLLFITTEKKKKKKKKPGTA